MNPDERPPSDPRTRSGGTMLIVAGIIAVALLVAIMAILAGGPSPQQGEILPNAPPQGTEAQ